MKFATPCEHAATQLPDTVDLFGARINRMEMQQAVDAVMQWCDDTAGGCRFVVTPNVDHVVMLQRSADLKAAYADAGLVLADGFPVVLAARLLGRKLPERLAGSDLVPALFDRADTQQLEGERQQPLRVYLLGAAPGVAERAARNVHDHWQGVEIVGTYSPPLGFENDEAENEAILARIAEANPQVVLVGLGAPKQELWVHKYQDRIPAQAALCIGATIDFLAGQRSRAPVWMQKSGLEWLHRLCSEPRRLFGRYAHDAWIFPQVVWRQWRMQRHAL